MKSLKDKDKNRRGAAIELAIFALALMSIVGTLIISITLSETRYVKEDRAELSEFTSRLEREERVKAKFAKTVSNMLGFIQVETELEYTTVVDGYEYFIKYELGLDGKIRITSWEEKIYE